MIPATNKYTMICLFFFIVVKNILNMGYKHENLLIPFFFNSALYKHTCKKTRVRTKLIQRGDMISLSFLSFRSSTFFLQDLIIPNGFFLSLLLCSERYLFSFWELIRMLDSSKYDSIQMVSLLTHIFLRPEKSERHGNIWSVFSDLNISP